MPQIFVLGLDGGIVPMVERPYDTEAVLQELLERFPDLMPGDEIDAVAPRRWLLVRREAGIAFEGAGGDRWSVDHLFLDQDGIPTLVEVKRASDTRARREVVAQMLDYAASFAFSSVDDIRARFEASCAERGEDPLGLIARLRDDQDADVDAFWSAVATNLDAGRLRLLFVADKISAELRRIIEFLNSQLRMAEVLAIEVRQWEGTGGMKTLVPTVIGQTARAEAAKSRSGSPGRLTEEEYRSALRERNAAEVVSGFDELMRWGATAGASVTYGRGRAEPSCYLNWTASGTTVWPLAIWASGSIGVIFETLQRRPPFDDENLREQLRHKMNTVAGVSLPEGSLRRQPTFPLTVLADGPARDQLIGVLQWFVDQLDR